MEYFDKIVHTYKCQHYLSTAMHNSFFFGGRGFAWASVENLGSVSENAHNSWTP